MSNLITHFPFHMPQLNRNRAIRVLLPRNYDKDKDRRYPVIYINDGQNLFSPETAAFRHWKLKEFMERQPLNKQAILVGIDNGGIDRTQEYAPHFRGQKGGQGDLYLQFVEHTLKPFIDSQYRTWPHREATGMVGSSLGGLITLYAGIRYAHVFGKIGVLSPAIWFNPRVLTLVNAKTTPKSKIYVAASKTEMESMAATLEKTYWTFSQAGYTADELRVVIRDRGRHSETFWAQEFKPMYEWLLF